MFADVEGANVVGYLNKNSDVGSSVMTPVFQSIGDSEKVLVSDLKLTGYQEAYKGAGEEVFDQYLTMTKMDEFGYSMDNTLLFGDRAFQLAWFDEIRDGEWFGGYWVDVFGTGEAVTKENDIEFDFGEGLVVSTPDPMDEEVLQIVSSGAVAADDLDYELPVGSSVIGNPMPATTYVSKVTIGGYQEAYKGAGEEDFDQYLAMTTMDEFGYSMDNTLLFGDKAFQLAWFDEIRDGEWFGGYWIDVYGTGEPVVEGDDDIPLPPGTSLVISTPDPIDEEVLTISFASPIAKHDAE